MADRRRRERESEPRQKRRNAKRGLSWGYAPVSLCVHIGPLPSAGASVLERAEGVRCEYAHLFAADYVPE